MALSKRDLILKSAKRPWMFDAPAFTQTGLDIPPISAPTAPPPIPQIGAAPAPAAPPSYFDPAATRREMLMTKDKERGRQNAIHDFNNAEILNTRKAQFAQDFPNDPNAVAFNPDLTSRALSAKRQTLGLAPTSPDEYMMRLAPEKAVANAAMSRRVAMDNTMTTTAPQMMNEQVKSMQVGNQGGTIQNQLASQMIAPTVAGANAGADLTNANAGQVRQQTNTAAQMTAPTLAAAQQAVTNTKPPMSEADKAHLAYIQSRLHDLTSVAQADDPDTQSRISALDAQAQALMGVTNQPQVAPAPQNPVNQLTWKNKQTNKAIDAAFNAAPEFVRMSGINPSTRMIDPNVVEKTPFGEIAGDTGGLESDTLSKFQNFIDQLKLVIDNSKTREAKNRIIDTIKTSPQYQQILHNWGGGMNWANMPNNQYTWLSHYTHDLPAAQKLTQELIALVGS